MQRNDAPSRRCCVRGELCLFQREPSCLDALQQSWEGLHDLTALDESYRVTLKFLKPRRHIKCSSQQKDGNWEKRSRRAAAHMFSQGMASLPPGVQQGARHWEKMGRIFLPRLFMLQYRWQSTACEPALSFIQCLSHSYHGPGSIGEGSPLAHRSH